MQKQRGFTLIELLVVSAIIAILAAVVVINLNPSRQFAQARNTQRWSDINSILLAVSQRMADTRGVFKTGCPAGAIPTSTTQLGSASGNYNIGPCLVPIYLSVMPLDPSIGTSSATGYNISRDATSGMITFSAPHAELGGVISIIR